MLLPLALAACLSSCSSDKDDDLPGISECQGIGCTSGGTSTGGGGSSGASGQGGSSGSTQTVGVTITGTVRQFTEPTFDTTKTTVFTLGANISASPSGTLPAVATALDTGTFSLDNVASGNSWILAQPSNSGQQTLAGRRDLTIKASGNGDIDAYVVDQSVFINILASLPTQTSLNTSAAHAVISFVDSQGAPVSGVSATSTVFDATNTTTAAIVVGDNGPDYGGTVSGVRGQILVLNFGATSSAKLTYQPSGSTQATTIGIANAAATVTFLTIVVP